MSNLIALKEKKVQKFKEITKRICKLDIFEEIEYGRMWGFRGVFKCAEKSNCIQKIVVLQVLKVKEVIRTIWKLDVFEEVKHVEYTCIILQSILSKFGYYKIRYCSSSNDLSSYIES